jgi:hypothetical protein
MVNKFLMAASIIAFTQTAHAQYVRLGVHTGGNMSNAVSEQSNKKETSKLQAGFHAGVTVDVALTSDISAFIPLQFIVKGGKEKSTETLGAAGLQTVITTDVNQPINYVQLPLNIVYNFDLGETSKFFVGAGPSFAYALSGKAKGDITTVQTTTFGGQTITNTNKTAVNQKLKIGSSNTDNIKPFEIGVNAVAGVKLNSGFAVTANYTYALNNVATQNNSSYKGRSFGLSLHYLFGAAKED